MSKPITSEGKCFYCDEKFSQKGIAKHLARHLSATEKEKLSEKERGYHLSIEAGNMFLQVLIKGSSRFQVLDAFLRDIWVECCEHLSDFHHKNIEIGMSDKFFRVLSPKMKFDYIYDYGSTTSFPLKVEGVYQIDQKEDIVLLSRNEPLKILCSLCKKNSATSICTVHAYQTDECFFCEKCAAKHGKKCGDFSDYAEMPVVNSPRMGICGYTGGRVDVERDGVYKA
jgi:hypothetical protein